LVLQCWRLWRFRRKTTIGTGTGRNDITIATGGITTSGTRGKIEHMDDFWKNTMKSASAISPMRNRERQRAYWHWRHDHSDAVLFPR